MQEYEPKMLKRIKELEVEILKDFMQVCEKHGLQWFTTFGTLIGVVRHQGYIPWDDDLDVAMMRKDYEKFLRIASKELGEKYDIVTVENHKNYQFMFAKLSLKGTKFMNADYIASDCELGVYIDIFPYDYTAKGKISQAIHFAKSFFWSKLYVLSYFSDVYLLGNTFVVWTATRLCKMINWGIRKLHISREFIRKMYKKQTIKYSDTGLITILSTRSPKRWVIAEQEIFPLKKMKFEGIEVNVPNNYDTYLKNGYGDYKKLPPVELRFNHRPEIIELGKYQKKEDI